MVAHSLEAVAEIRPWNAGTGALPAGEEATGSLQLLESGAKLRLDDPHAALATAKELLEGGATERAVAILRALPDHGRNRAEAVELSILAGQMDPEFQRWIAQADRERDARDWAAAEHSYWRALQLYPLHHGYRVQYGHSLKEQGKAAEAEVEYRSALALGAPVEDVRTHIIHVHAALGDGDAPFPRANRQAADPDCLPLNEAPTRADIEALFTLLLQRPPNNRSETLSLLRTAATRRDVVQLLVVHEEFPRANRELMLLLAQTL